MKKDYLELKDYFKNSTLSFEEYEQLRKKGFEHCSIVEMYADRAGDVTAREFLK